MPKVPFILRIFLALAVLETIVHCLASEAPRSNALENEDNLSNPLALMAVPSTNNGDYPINKRSGLLNRITDIMAAQRPRARGGPYWNPRPSEVLAELPDLAKDDLKIDDYQEPDVLPAVQLNLASRKAKICYMNPVSCFGRRMRSEN